MRRKRRLWAFGAVLAVGVAAMLVSTFASAAPEGAQHVRWDIVHLAFTTPPTVTAGGIASAKTPEGETITVTGSGTFVAPASGGGSGAATGGGTWTTSTGGSGTYTVTRLVDWEFANFQLPVLNDQIGGGRAANGTAVLEIAFSDGTDGVLTVGCHGPGAPAGIFEGIATTKGFKTYYNVQAPAPGVDANRTTFHVR